jgi:hypothetical protein
MTTFQEKIWGAGCTKLDIEVGADFELKISAKCHSIAIIMPSYLSQFMLIFNDYSQLRNQDVFSTYSD